jgi:hypothetical protein
MATATRHNKNSVLEEEGALVERGGIGEEKKSSDEERPISTSVIPVAGFVDVNDVTEQEDPRFSKFEELPDELATLRDQIFENQSYLLKAIDDLGFGDVRVILGDNGRAYLFIPGSIHNNANSKIVNDFTLWAANWKGFASGDRNICINQTIPMVPPPPRQFILRPPDISFWGNDKCERDESNRLSPKPTNAPDEVNPDVVTQFSWQNTMDCETHALNDIMIRSETFGSDTPPRIGYLIKVRFGVVPGFDIYKVPHGTTVDDAMNNRHGAEHLGLQCRWTGCCDQNHPLRCRHRGTSCGHLGPHPQNILRGF